MLATLVWAGFWVLGRPDYYQQYSSAGLLWFVVLLLIPIGAVVYRVLRPVKRRRRVTVSLWIAFYFTAPLAFYDWLYCGVYLGHGTRFLVQFWYLSVYYIIPWVLMPGMVMILNRRRDGSTDAGAPEGGL